VEPLGLPAFQRRALVLIAFGVMSNVLLTRSRGVHAGNIDLVLSRVSHVRGRLAIHHSGMVMLCRDGQQISNDLASLLETRIIYGGEDRADCIVEMDFPLSGNMS
jgi:hypothetical protein